MFAPAGRYAGLGDALDDAADGGDGPDPLYQQMHILALQIVHQRQIANTILNNVANADADVDWTALNQALQSIVNLKGQLVIASDAFKAAHPSDLTPFDNAILAVGDWANQVLSYLPNAIAAIPKAILDGLGNIAKDAGNSLLDASLPWLVLGGIGLFALTKVEKTRTYRKYAA